MPNWREDGPPEDVTPIAPGAGGENVHDPEPVEIGKDVDPSPVYTGPEIEVPEAIAEPDYGGAFQTALARTRNRPAATPRLLGLVGTPTLRESTVKYDGTTKVDNGLTRTFDTTTYTDRAVITLANGLGYNCYLTMLQVDGKRVMLYSNSLVFEDLKRDDDIRRNGEKIKTIASDFIITAAQAAKVGDYWYKYTANAKHIYTIAIPGLAPWYSVGEWYDLSLGAPDTNEYIDAVVECYSVECERVAGEIGQTVARFREVQEAWAKTTFYSARALSGGGPRRKGKRSNVIVVASSTYSGTYDYLCDGTADDVQIQEAIDILTGIGGGEIDLTEGNYYCLEEIVANGNITILGTGQATKIYISEIGVSLSLGASASKIAFYNMGAEAPITASDSGTAIENCNVYNSIAVTVKNDAFIRYSTIQDTSRVILEDGGNCVGNTLSSTYYDATRSSGVITANLNTANIQNNTITQGASADFIGTYAHPDASGVTINGNKIVGATINTANDSVGIFLDEGNDHNITGNTILSLVNSGAGVGHGIFIGCDRGNIVGNISLYCDVAIEDQGTNTNLAGNITS